MPKFLESVLELPSSVSIAIYGGGETGVTLYRDICQKRPDISVICFFDSFREGSVEGLPLYLYDKACELHTEIMIVVASVFWPQIVPGLDRAQRDTCRITANSYIYNTSLLVSGGEFETNQQEQIDNLNLISAARNLFHREIDRSLFDVLLAAHSFDRAERDTASLRIPNFCSGAEQYFEFGTPSFGSIIVEGGVFDGRDSCVYLGHIGDVGKIYGFEPFPELVTQGPYWHKLSNTENFKLTPLALWDSCMDLLFTSGGSVGSGSGISAVAEGRVVSATSLDNFAARESLTRVDIIKLDIEGAEMNALNGARRIIRRDHPTLAISLYHHRTHLYLLPLLIHSMYSGYRFYIGQYTGMFVDTVLYAVGN